MLKYLLLSLLITTPALANRDSVAYFYSAKKVNVLLNERGQNTRIAHFMDSLRMRDSMLLVSENKDIKLGCATGELGATCTFTFYPSEYVELIDKKLFVETQTSLLGIGDDVEFEMSFKGSMKDQIQLKISNGVLTIFASK